MLLFHYLVHQHSDVTLLQRTEAESRASTQKRRAELVRVIGNDAESGVGCVLFHDSSQSHLRCTCHGISLIQYDELEASHRVARTARGATHGEDLFSAGECLDLLSHNVDTTVV
ncbi:hypothetical protein HG530_008841 [Fusarium avenaceum]|nr:hypothetical protein HG530_008841 [Fusarium avenaceum]